jgi:hypothetical protein
MKDCTGHAKQSSAECHIDVLALLPLFEAAERIFVANDWIKAGSHLQSKALSPAHPPPISVV